MSAVLAIYARENGQGMFFDANEEFEAQADVEDGVESSVTTQAAPVLASVPAGRAEESADVAGDGDDRPRPGGGRPSLRVVK